MAARYMVGIDLGTTNCAVAFIDSAAEAPQVQTFAIAQLTAPGTVERRDTLPSFHYEPAKGEFEPGALALPWSEEPLPMVGVLARDHGAAVPGRLVVSAKSWLSHGGVDRSAALLPWHGAADVQRHSPGTVSGRFLKHIRQAWDHEHPDAPLAEQEVVLTVPASFDEVARELTLEAAQKAGLPKICLIEEPQAAFYAWMHAHPHSENSGPQPGQTVLVCDIGGGTTDLTLIQVDAGTDGTPAYRRIAVGEHLILGGDNLDLALAHHIEKRVGGEPFSPAAWSTLVRRCQQAKETLLQPDAPECCPINLPVRGRRVVGGSQQLELARDEVLDLLADGFLPAATLQDRPDTRHSGFQEFGLPYAPDAAITRYLMAFLAEHAETARPNHILFNGGFFGSPVLRDRLLATLESALGTKPNVLANPRLDLAVAHGAATYGLARRGQAVRIGGGLPRGYYLGVGHADLEQTPKAVCLLPAGLEEGESIALAELTFKLLIRQPVEFPLYTATARPNDRPGDLVDATDETLCAMPPIKTVVHAGKKKKAAGTVDVHLHASLTEVGTIELWCAEAKGNRKWRLQFDARGGPHPEQASAEDRGGIVDEGIVEASLAVLGGGLGSAPNRLVKELEAATQLSRNAWPPALLRAWFEPLLALEPCRRSNAETESRWLNLLGYALRPGYGFSVDDWRVAQVWRIFNQGVAHHRNEMCRAEWWILWRRIAGGLLDTQQQTMADPLIKAWRARVRNTPGQKPAKMNAFQFGDHESAEVWRVLGSLERISPASKEELGGLAVQWIERKGIRISNGAAVWALGRIGARVPAYGPLNAVVHPDVAAEWADKVLALSDGDAESSFALMQLCRRTGDRYRDLPAALRKRVCKGMEAHGAPARHIDLVRDGGLLDAEEQDRSFGEALPPGLHLGG